MGRKPRSMRNKRTTSRASEETSGANAFTAPTSENSSNSYVGIKRIHDGRSSKSDITIAM